MLLSPKYVTWQNKLDYYPSISVTRDLTNCQKITFLRNLVSQNRYHILCTSSLQRMQSYRGDLGKEFKLFMLHIFGISIIVFISDHWMLQSAVVRNQKQVDLSKYGRRILFSLTLSNIKHFRSYAMHASKRDIFQTLKIVTIPDECNKFHIFNVVTYSINNIFP